MSLRYFYRFSNNDFEVNDYLEFLHDNENHGLKQMCNLNYNMCELRQNR